MAFVWEDTQDRSVQKVTVVKCWPVISLVLRQTALKYQVVYNGSCCLVHICLPGRHGNSQIRVEIVRRETQILPTKPV